MSSAPAILPTATAAAPSAFGQRTKLLLSSTPLPLLIAIVIIIIIAVVVFLIMKYKKGALKSVDLLGAPVVIANPLAGEHQISPAGKLPASQNGTENTYSLWLFIDSVSITNNHKIVLYRGNPQSYSNGQFFVYMDSKTNKLYASVRTNGVTDETSSSNEPSLEDIRINKYFMQSVIDYIPLQRWVNIAYTVKDTVFSTYLDGELYSVTSIYEMAVKPDGSRPLPIKPTGDILIAGKAGKEGFNGYIGSGKYLNFAITVTEAKVLYNQGPYKKSWLSYLGLGNVGLRSPVYKISVQDLKEVK
jgi:hypothetical protein